MSTSFFTPSLFAIPTIGPENTDFLLPNCLDSPIIVSFSPSLAFRISQNSQNQYVGVVEVLSKNGSPLEIKPFYHNIFIKQFATVCQAKLGELSLKFKNVNNYV